MTFASVDLASDPHHFVRYLASADEEPVIRGYKDRLLDGLGPLRGRTVVDLGCGRGTDLVALAERVGPRGRVLGVDASQHMLDAARAQLASRSSVTIELVHADAAALPFDDANVDALRIDRVLVHVPSPEAVLAEAFRVLRPGGRLVVAEGDYATLMLDHPDLELTDRILSVWPSLLAHGRIGRTLPRLARAAGFVDLAIDVVGLPFDRFEFADPFLGLTEGLQVAIGSGVVDAMTATLWWLALDEERRAGRFFASLSGVGVFARRP
jgi:SAM-dependent methyltransferase